MSLPSMERCLAERFGTTGFTARVKERIGGEEIYLDALASSRGESGTVCVVEVKSRLREGLVLARISDDVFELAVPEDFEPRAFPNPAGGLAS